MDDHMMIGAPDDPEPQIRVVAIDAEGGPYDARAFYAGWITSRVDMVLWQQHHSMPGCWSVVLAIPEDLELQFALLAGRHDAILRRAPLETIEGLGDACGGIWVVFDHHVHEVSPVFDSAGNPVVP